MTAPLTISGGGGTDSVALDDEPLTSSHTYTLTSNSLSRDGKPLVSYSNFKSLTLNGSNAHDQYNIESTAAGTPVVINGSNNEDDITMCPTTQDLRQIAGHLTLNGGGGNNFLTVDDLEPAPRREHHDHLGLPQPLRSAGLAYSGFFSVELEDGAHRTA